MRSVRDAAAVLDRPGAGSSWISVQEELRWCQVLQDGQMEVDFPARAYIGSSTGTARRQSVPVRLRGPRTARRGSLRDCLVPVHASKALKEEHIWRPELGFAADTWRRYFTKSTRFQQLLSSGVVTLRLTDDYVRWISLSQFTGSSASSPTAIAKEANDLPGASSRSDISTLAPRCPQCLG